MTEEIDLSGVPEKSKTPESNPIVPLGVDEFTVKDVTSGVSSKKKTAFIEVSFENSKGVPFADKFYLTPKALDKLREFLRGCDMPEEQINRTDMKLQEIKDFVVGKQIRMIIKGEEYLNQEGKKRTRRTLPFKFYCESITVPKDKSRLKFDEKWHLDKLEGVPTSDSKDDSDLPF